MSKTILTVAFMSWSTIVLSQNSDDLTKDSISRNIRFGLMGDWQKGNLNQWSLMPNLSANVSNHSYFAQINISYDYLFVQDFAPLNDFWANGLFQYKQHNRFYFVANSIVGYAKSYKIRQSIYNGIGIGTNIKKNEPRNYIQCHVLGGFLNLQFENQFTSPSSSVCALIRTQFPVNKQLFLKWELATYNSIKEGDNFGGNNLIQINASVGKGLFFNLTHEIFYTNLSIQNSEKLNSVMFLGMQFQLSN